jgi:hypothetical protein
VAHVPVILANQGGSDQEGHGSKPVWSNSSQDPIISKIPITKKGWVEWLKVYALSSNPSMAKINK